MYKFIPLLVLFNCAFAQTIILDANPEDYSKEIHVVCVLPPKSPLDIEGCGYGIIREHTYTDLHPGKRYKLEISTTYNGVEYSHSQIAKPGETRYFIFKEALNAFVKDLEQMRGLKGHIVGPSI